MNTKRYCMVFSSLLLLLIVLDAARAQALAGIPDAWIRSVLKSHQQAGNHQQALKSRQLTLKSRRQKTTRIVYQPAIKKRMLAVTATAYTSHVAQTDSTPEIAAWGDRLRPGMKVVAVSRDLLNQYGLTRGSKIKIHGLPGHYVVLDKMNKRWRKKIDIYMGKDRREAFKWGRRKVTIEWAG